MTRSAPAPGDVGSQQQPVAWMVRDPDEPIMHVEFVQSRWEAQDLAKAGYVTTPLFAALPVQEDTSEGEPETPMAERVEEFIRLQQWRADTPEDVRELVRQNLRGFAAWLSYGCRQPSLLLLDAGGAPSGGPRARSHFRSLACDDGDHARCTGCSGALDSPLCGCFCHGPGVRLPHPSAGVPTEGEEVRP